MIPKLRIAVIGCGMTGPAAALYLRRLGHEVVVYEQAAAPAPVGAGFLLQPPGLGVLEELGIRGAMEDCGSQVDRLYCETGEGKGIMDLSYKELGADNHALGLHRPYLLEGFLEKLEEAGVEVKWDCACVGMEKSESGWRLDFGSIEDVVDFVVVADGAGSRLRAMTEISHRVRQYRWGAFWYIGVDHEGVFDRNTLYQVVDGSDVINGFLPTGVTRNGERLVSLFWSLEHARIDEVKARGIGEWRESIVQMTPKAEGLISQIEGFDDLSVARYHDVVCPRLDGDRVVLLGDAGHAMSPVLGQGVNLGLMDAKALGQSFEEESDLSSALSGFSRERKAHLRFYQYATRWSTPFFQSDQNLFGALRNFGFPLAGRIPYARKEMVRTMMGVKTGVTGRGRIS